MKKGGKQSFLAKIDIVFVLNKYIGACLDLGMCVAIVDFSYNKLCKIISL